MANPTWQTGLIGGIEKREIKLFEYDPSWPRLFEKHSEIVRRALLDRALMIEHIGSTSVPGLAAKPIIDMLLVVEDSSDEDRYLPALEKAGYVLRVREPDFHEHRMVRTPERDVQIHIFSIGSTEVERHLVFRDRLRECAEDRRLYEETKRSLAQRSWEDTNAYAQAKTGVIEEIIAKCRRD